MYVDMGQRGRIRFSWKEVVAVWALVLATVGHYTWTKVQLDDLREKYAQCQHDVDQLKQQLNEQIRNRAAE